MNKGQSLFEVVLALGIISIIIVGVVLLASSSIRNSSFSRNKTQAARYAQETTEWLRGERDTSWETFLAKAQAVTWCLPALSWASAINRSCHETEVISGTPFQREVAFSFPEGGDANTIEAEIKVYWNDSQGLHEVNSITVFTNWRTQ